MQLREKPLDSDEKKLEATLLEWLSEFGFASFGVAVHAATEDKMVLQKTIQPQLIHAIEKRFGVSLQFVSPDLVVTLDFRQKRMEISTKSVFVEGRYNKFSRDVAQTIHYCRHCRGHGCTECKNTGKTTADSVQEIIGRVLVPAFDASEGLFHGAGREDVDVRMLGTGRPFVFELVQPKKRKADLEELQQRVNTDARVKVKLLGVVEKTRMQEVKMALHDKVYEAKVESGAPLDHKRLESIVEKPLAVSQQTPLRVVKRRADLLHEKTAQLLGIEWVSDTVFSIKLRTSAGLYVKEFVSGDSGRTSPSISELAGAPCVCRELDVLEIVAPKT
ncbi:MAG: tRNA pseudouridine(54/55) synthase Pus10 [Candidatus Diapherotrites archaeon]|nr:tRNA pseudouridine(54/55) synthase Pus10 [Candidatus Diapherotrites archaeon]